jgi:hypothetical protein
MPVVTFADMFAESDASRLIPATNLPDQEQSQEYSGRDKSVLEKTVPLLVVVLWRKST